MSNRRKIKARRTRGKWPTPGVGEVYVHQPAVALDRRQPDAIDVARRAAHDSLIEQLGETRRSGVWWTEHYSGQADAVLDDLYGGDVRTGEVGKVRAAMRNPAAALVMAWCIATPPDGKPEDTA